MHLVPVGLDKILAYIDVSMSHFKKCEQSYVIGLKT